MGAAPYRGDAEEVLRQASAVLGRPVTLWEVTGAHQAVRRAIGSAPAPAPAAAPEPAAFDLDATLRTWKVPVAVGSRWVAAPPAPGAPSGSWLVAPVRSEPPAPPPDGRERRSRERLALELAGLALGLIDRGGPAVPSGSADALRELADLPAMIAHQAGNPLAAARAGLQLAMEAVGRWTDLAADRRLSLLDDLGQVIDDIDRATQFLHAVQDRARGALVGKARGDARSERFDAVRVVSSCLTLERRLLRDRGIELDFAGTLEPTFLTGDPNALFDVLVNLVRHAADASTQRTAPVEVRLARKGRELELTVRDHGAGIAEPQLARIWEPGGAGAMGLAKVRSVAEAMFGGNVRVASQPGQGTTFTINLPLPPQRDPGVVPRAAGREADPA